MAKKSSLIKPYTKYPRAQAQLDHWVGPMQHWTQGVSTDPVHEEVPPGSLKSKQYVKKEQKG